MTQSNTPISVDIVSDVACPWCYLGKRRIEEAIPLVSDIPVTIQWRPYQLDPTIPPEGVDRKAYMTAKFGDLEAMRPAHDRLVAMGNEVGIDYRFDDMKLSANTLDAHRLIRWSAAEGLQNEVVEGLFRANFTEGRNIGDKSVLADIAAEAGMNRDAVAASLATDQDIAEVQQEIAEAQRIGVTGVPCFIVAGRYAVAGAHPAEAIADVIRKAAAERAAS